MQEAQTTLPIGSVVRDRYVVEHLLGKGGFGAVYLVSDRRVRGNQFALKEVIEPSKQERERFTFECNVLRRLDHPALPQVYHAFDDERMNRAYMLMDFIDGPNLETLRLQQIQKRFPLPEAMTIMASVVGAVTYLHQQQPPVIHRDIKPSNIIVPEGSTLSTLVDLGIAKEYHQDSTTTAVRRCSPGYGAPEQYGFGTSPQTDIYGLGATLYALLTGAVPTDALYRLTQLGSKHPDPLVPANQLNPELAEEVALVIQRAMCIDYADRYTTVEAFWEALKAAARWQESLIPPPESMVLPLAASTSAVKPLGARRRVRRRVLVLALVCLLVTCALVTGFSTGILPPLLYASAPRVSATKVSTHAAATRPVVKVTPGATKATIPPTPTPSPIPPTPPQPTPDPDPVVTPTAVYPVMASFYQGTIHNTPANLDAAMSLSAVRQQGATIQGNFVLSGTQLIGSGAFQGSVSEARQVQFLVQSGQVAPLLFTGTIQSDGSMNGEYCSVDAGTHCNVNAGGYGTWSVAPGTAAASVPTLADRIVASPPFRA